MGGVEVMINSGLQQASAALSMAPQLPHRDDYGRLQIDFAGSQKNMLSPLIVAIDCRVRRIISFARQVPGFDTLILDDQICLVKRQFATLFVI